MNKQELIEKLSVEEESSRRYEKDAFRNGESENYYAGYTDMAIYSQTLVNALEEPEKVTIPKMVADWITSCREYSWTLMESMSLPNMTEKELQRWFLDGKEKSELFARAWLDGYKVESIPKWKIPLMGMKLGDFQAYLSKMPDGNYTIADNCRFDVMLFSDDELTKVPMQYRGFAVPIEGAE